ncbi:MAG: hypothetical protein V7691_02965 [Galbibacter orientalis]|uniref:peptidoglycan-binding domain-containing protein n=1 Tax=Galbibacter orientalis TaxID=453852 RepID=UPI00300194FC
MRTTHTYQNIDEIFLAELNTSNQVREVQEFLHTKGFDLGGYGVDGKLGRKTKSALYNYFKTQIGGAPIPTPVTPPVTPPSGTSKLDRFITAHGTKTFRNSAEINAFFSQLTGKDFCSWFKDEIGNKGYWGSITFEGRSRHGRSIPRGNFSTHQQNFNRVWNNIPLVFFGIAGNQSINIFQFFALVSIIINETGGKFVPISEIGNLAYMFGTNSGRKRSYNTASGNKSAYELFRDTTFLSAHQQKPYHTQIANTTNSVWRGEIYPSTFPNNPVNAGIISEADFYKFRGRGLIQTTFRSTYSRLLGFIKSYNGNNSTLNTYKTRWQSLSTEAILSGSSNADWDNLFMNTNLEFPCYAIYNFQNRRNNFLSIPANKAKLLQTSTSRSGSGSLFYVGYRVGGSARYGRLLKLRVIQMIEKLVS